MACAAKGKNMFKKIINNAVLENITNYVTTLDPNKSYILVLPETFDPNEVKNQLKSLEGINLIVFISDNVRLLEF